MTKKDRRAKARKLPDDVYEAELFRLQAELVKLQQWVRATGARVVVVFEGVTRPARAARSSGSPST
ncbi:hypothetical protein GCM10025864_09020 [Luteimicrobium album]|uniref:Polyphosphate kinase-2-related domain-containing protein n=1 Tax=Luteimicrobium album TaxID=1054550 RepID=A0ABQ6HXA4_9MICO|nr:hypothetical protein GCM10025864_09020 [Luteimicrobium album]